MNPLCLFVDFILYMSRSWNINVTAFGLSPDLLITDEELAPFVNAFNFFCIQPQAPGNSR